MAGSIIQAPWDALRRLTQWTPRLAPQEGIYKFLTNELQSSNIKDNTLKTLDQTTVPKDKQYFMLDVFLDEHPQSKTHKARMTEEKNAKVPNFQGGILPKKDQGNHEDYCMTMLTLFKPWRTGFQLKELEQSWSEAFEQYEFTERQKEIMKFSISNMNAMMLVMIMLLSASYLKCLMVTSL
jgi:hypothetical protein